MKITLLTNEYPPHVYGGAGVHVEYLSRELARVEGGRHEVHVLCFGEQKKDQGNLTIEGVPSPPLVLSQEPRTAKLLDTFVRDILMAGAAPRADLVHCHTWYTHLAGCLAKQILGIPLVITTHSLEPQRPWKVEQLGSGYRASGWIEKTAYENADGVIAVSKSMKEAVEDIYRVSPEKVRVIPNGIDVNQYRPSFDPNLLAKYGIDPAKPFVLFVGRITRQKGVVHLVRAIRWLRPGTQVVLCAGAPDTEEIGREIAEKVREARSGTGNEIIWIDQWVPREEVVPLFSHASIFVCPSIYEPFGIINLEAMACGTPVVASAVGGIPDVILDGDTGLLVPFEPVGVGNPEPKNPDRFSEDLAAAVNRLLASPDELKRMGHRARERVVERFSWESVARQTLDFYRGILDKP